MPVLGHAFVGLAIGVSTRRSDREQLAPPRIGAAPVLWLPAVVTLAYLPDIVAQLGVIAGWSDGRLLGHSVLFAFGVSPAIAVVLMWLARVSVLRALLTALVSLLVHDTLDLAQATDRMPWWPLSDRHVGFELGLIPTDFLREATVFGGLLLAFLALRHAANRWGGQSAMNPRISDEGQVWLVWLGRAFILAVVSTAVVTHSLRDARDSQLETGRALVEQRAYQAALEVLAGAESWPSTTKPGRIDYVRAEAYAGMGDRRRAEASYLRADRADRTYFWAVADLALFYASSNEPAGERRRMVAPYLNRLRAEFAGHPALPQVLARVERQLAATRSGGAPDSSTTRDGLAPAAPRSDG
jgi:hypothetical protein